EFIEALKLMATAMDNQRNTSAHGQALAAALHAVNEADDFVARGTTIDANLRLADIVSGHQTPVLKDTDLANVSPTIAQHRYLTFAQEQFANAAADLQPASAALYGLGKLQMIPERGKTAPDLAALGRSVVYFQAALVVHPRHALAANELGVVLKRCGRLEDARNLLVHSARISGQPIAWRNLAVVHRELGELDLAQRAEHEAQIASARPGAVLHAASAAPAVEWVDPAAFAQAGQADLERPTPGGPNAALQTANKTPSRSEPNKAEKRSAFRLPWDKTDRK
ncbi:MAG: hypothetical protein SGJ20_00205, partial [Planctomycetota bacterium]|nr:hypothetical protein [Planctomycetota bacterium]